MRMKIEESRKLCKCHGLPMHKAGHNGFCCSVKANERHKTYRLRHPDRAYEYTKKYLAGKKARAEALGVCVHCWQRLGIKRGIL